VWTVHNIMEHERRFPQLELFFHRLLFRFYDKVIVHCTYAQAAIIEAYRVPDYLIEKIHVIPIGEYGTSYDNQISRGNARERLEIDNGKTVFLFFGYLRTYKGILHLIETFKNIKNERIELVVAGKPANSEIQEILLEVCREDPRIVTFLGYVPEDDVQIYMNAADFVVLPFMDILTSASCMLAMSFGRAIIAPRMGCIPEYLDSKGGILYDPEGDGALSRALQGSLSANFTEMDLHNLQKVQSFDWKSIGELTCQVYKECFDE